MLHTLAQSGGGSMWSSPQFYRMLVIVVAVLFSLLGGVIRKVNEQKAKRAAELGRQHRRDEMLRTGRDETGAFVDVTRTQPVQQESPVSTDDARRKLQELADRRRRELAEMMRRAQQGGAAPTRPGAQAPARSVPPAIARAPMPERSRQRSVPPMPAAPVFAPRQQQQATERDIRRRREEQANKKAAKEAAARRKAQEQERPPPAARAETIPRHPARASTTVAAYEIAKSGSPASGIASQQAASTQVVAAMARVAGSAGNSEWRKAIIMGELLRPPVSMRPPDERVA